jgi:hypothetical protein
MLGFDFMGLGSRIFVYRSIQISGQCLWGENMAVILSQGSQKVCSFEKMLPESQEGLLHIACSGFWKMDKIIRLIPF